MALAFEVCQLRGTSYSASGNSSGGKKSVTVSFTKKFLVKATGITSPDEVTDIQVAYANGIPLVNYHTWYDQTTGLGYPLAVCKSKKVTRLDNNGFVFHVDCTFSTEPSQKGKDGPEEEQAPEVPPVNVTDIAPQISRAVVGREIVLYEAPAYSGVGPVGGVDGVKVSTRVMPSSGNKLQEMFEAPVTRTKPLLNLTVTQFEDTFTNQQMMDRCYKVNDADWAGFVTASVMITGINAVKQAVQMASGMEEKYRVTYTLSYDDYTVTDSGLADLFVGHSAALPLVSRSYLDAAQSNSVKMFAKTGVGIGNVGLVDVDGHQLPNQNGPPDYIRFDTVDEISFSFLPAAI